MLFLGGYGRDECEYAEEKSLCGWPCAGVTTRTTLMISTYQ